MNEMNLIFLGYWSDQITSEGPAKKLVLFWYLRAIQDFIEKAQMIRASKTTSRQIDGVGDL